MSLYSDTGLHDLAAQESSNHPQLYKEARQRNAVLQKVMLKDATDKITAEKDLELKRISQERTLLENVLRKLVVDKTVARRSDVPGMRYNHNVRRKSHEFEDLTFTPVSEPPADQPTEVVDDLMMGIQTQNLLAYKNFGRATRLISRDMVKKAMSDERLTTIKELRKYKHWEGDPEAIGSVRRMQKPRSTQLEDVDFCRTRKFDRKLRQRPSGSASTTSEK